MGNTSGDSALSVLLSVAFGTWWIILLTTDQGKPFDDANFLMKFILEDCLFGVHIPDARKVKLLIHAVWWVHGIWPLKWEYKVFVFFLKIDMPSGDNSKSRKCGVSFWIRSTVQRKLIGSKLFERFCIRRTSLRLITHKVWSSYLVQNLIVLSYSEVW